MPDHCVYPPRAVSYAVNGGAETLFKVTADADEAWGRGKGTDRVE